jgi:flagellar biosynthesis/type III secretory pathway protein FliH
VSVADFTSLVTALGIFITAAISLLTYLRARQIEEQAKKIAERAEEIKTQGAVTHELVNSQAAERLAAGKSAAYKEGVTEGRLGKLEDRAK